MKQQGIIYKITNLSNGKIYVGQTIMTLRARMRAHVYSKNCKLLKRAIDKYGIDNFSIEEIERTDNLSEREIFWINSLQANYSLIGYNIRGFEDNVYGVSEDTKKKLSDIAISQKRIPPITLNSTTAQRGHMAAMRGFKPFTAYRKDSSYSKEFVSSGEAAKELGVEATHIRKILKGKGKSLKGFYFTRFGHETQKVEAGRNDGRCQPIPLDDLIQANQKDTL